MSRWKEEIHSFSKSTTLHSLKIISDIEGQTVSFVTFLASLRHENTDASFTEKSRFEKLDGKWLYRSGKVTPILP